MKAFVLTLCCWLALSNSLMAQATWQWARNLQAVRVNADATDAAGSVYVTGALVSSVSFTSPYFTGTLTLTPLGSSDIFLGCFDASGNLRWARQTGGAGASAEGLDIVADNGGGVYVVGRFVGTLTSNMGSGNLSAYGYNSAFVGRYTASAGGAVWSRRVGNDQYTCEGTSVALAPNYGCYLGGTLNNTVSFGSFSVTGGKRSAFVAQYNGSGIANWATVGNTNGGAPNSTSGSQVLGLASDATGNCYATGQFTTGLIFGSSTLPDNGWFTSQHFIAKLSPSNGAVAWLRGAPGSNSSARSEGNSIAVVGTNCYVGGTFAGTVDFGGGYNLLAGYPSTGYLGCYSEATGLTSWVRPLGYASGGVDVVANSSTVLASLGISSGSITYSKLAAYAPSGVSQWSLNSTGTGSSAAYDVALSGTNIYWLGRYQNSCSFGPYNLTTPLGQSYGYLARLTLPVALRTSQPVATRISMYPNPTSQALQVQWQAPEKGGTVQLSIRDAYGRIKLQDTRSATESLKLNVQTWQPGLYFVQLKGAGLQQTQLIRVK